MTNVIDAPIITRLPLNPERVLEAAFGRLSDVVIIGYTQAIAIALQKAGKAV